MSVSCRDNIFYRHGAHRTYWIKPKMDVAQMAAQPIFGYYVNDPERYGVVEFDEKRHGLSVEEKPKVLSKYAVTGLYFLTMR